MKNNQARVPTKTTCRDYAHPRAQQKPNDSDNKNNRKRGVFKPSLPSANFTCVGFSTARNASNILTLIVRMRHASAKPRPRPTRDPIAACVEIALAADLRASRSESLRLLFGGEVR